MPELPEVAVLARDLSAFFGSSRLRAIHFRGKHRLLGRIVPRATRQVLAIMIGRPLQFSSLGKWLSITDGKNTVRLHLGMTGQFLCRPLRATERAHVYFTLNIGMKQCHFLDVRRFARMHHDIPRAAVALGGYSPSRGFFLTSEAKLRKALTARLSGFRTVARVSWLLRSGHETGVGNYMTNEALGRLGLSPYDPCRGEAEALKILRSCQRIARESYRAGGTSFGNGYFRINGTRGRFTKFLEYYQNPRLTRQSFQGRSVYSRHKLSAA